MAVPYTFGTATSSIPLSQLDSNFNTVITLGNTAIQLGNTVTTLNNMTLANVTISSGNVTITNVTITTANVTTANIGTAFVSGNVSFTGTSNRITGDFSNATLASRVMFQTSTVNSNTVLNAIPNGTATASVLQLYANSDPTNTSVAQITSSVGAGLISFISGISGTGTYLPMAFSAGGSEAMRIAVAAGGIRAVGIGYTTLTGVGDNGLAVLGNVAVGSSSSNGKFSVTGSSNSNVGTFIGNASLTGSAPTYQGSIRLIDNPTSSTAASGGIEFLTSTFGSGYGFKIASVDSSGVSLTFAIRQNSASWTEVMRLDNASNVGIGTTSPGAKLDVTNNQAALSYLIDTNNTTNGGSSIWRMITRNIANTSTTSVEFYKPTGSGFYLNNNDTNASNFTAVSIGGTERMRIDSSGNVLVVNPAGLGYGTGSGGTVTQATSRTTGVTLSKPTGAITMFSAAGSAVAATFTVTNTLVAATDTIILNQKSGTNLYVLLVTAVAAGSFNITFYTTGGVATDAPVINFALIKGVTA